MCIRKNVFEILRLWSYNSRLELLFLIHTSIRYLSLLLFCVKNIVFFWNSDKRTLMQFYTATLQERNCRLQVFACYQVSLFISVFFVRNLFKGTFSLKNAYAFLIEKVLSSKRLKIQKVFHSRIMNFRYKHFMIKQWQRLFFSLSFLYFF